MDDDLAYGHWRFLPRDGGGEYVWVPWNYEEDTWGSYEHEERDDSDDEDSDDEDSDDKDSDGDTRDSDSSDSDEDTTDEDTTDSDTSRDSDDDDEVDALIIFDFDDTLFP